MTIKSFSWNQILNPFNYSALKIVYRGISTENRTSFWNITVSFVVAMLTAWLGFTISNNIQTSNEQLNTKMLRYGIVDRFGPVYDEYTSYTLPFFHDMMDLYPGFFNSKSPKLSSDEDAIKFIQYIEKMQNREKIIQMGDSTTSKTRIIMPYFSEVDRMDIEKNNFLITSACYTLKKIDSTKISHSAFAAELKNYLRTPEVAKMIGLNSNMDNIVNEAAKLYNMLYNTKGNLEHKLIITQLIIDMIIKPTIKNQQFLHEEMYGGNGMSNPVWESVLILLGAFLISYMLYRILILKVFVSRINLLSTDEYKKLEREKNKIEDENRILKLEVAELKRKAVSQPSM